MSALGTEVPATHGDRHWTHRHPERLPRGSAHWAAKLCEDDVRCIRASYPRLSMRYLSALFDVHRETISRIVHRETWRHL